VTLLTVIPWRSARDDAGPGGDTVPPRAAAGAAMAWAPAVGLLLGAIASAVLLLADHPLGAGPLTASGLAVGSLALLTRGLHLDAELADRRMGQEKAAEQRMVLGLDGAALARALDPLGAAAAGTVQR